MADNKFPPIDISKFPTFPAPWTSSDAGEAWLWDDYLIIIQREAPTLARLFQKMEGEKNLDPPSMEYIYSSLVYNFPEEGPVKPKEAPVIALSLEQAVYAHAKDIPPEVLKIIMGPDGKGPIMIGMFAQDRHYNFGPYTGALNRNAVREMFFNRLKDTLGLSGALVKLGPMEEGFTALRDPAAKPGGAG